MFSKRNLLLSWILGIFAVVFVLPGGAQDASDLVPPEVILPLPGVAPAPVSNVPVSAGGGMPAFGMSQGSNTSFGNNSSGIVFGQPQGWGFQGQGGAPAPAGAYTNYRGLQPGVNMTAPGQLPAQPGAVNMQSGPADGKSKDCPLCEKKKLEGQKLTNDGPGASWGQVMSKSDPVALIQTTKGPIIARLFRQYVPGTVNNFVELSQLGFYNGLRFHRVEPGFVIQSGCPKGDGTGGYTDPKTGKERRLPLELHQALRHNAPGVLAMARFGNDLHSASSQFYITLSSLPRLDDKYTVFGGVIQGLDVVNRITIQDRIISVQIQE